MVKIISRSDDVLDTYAGSAGEKDGLAIVRQRCSGTMPCPALWLAEAEGVSNMSGHTLRRNWIVAVACVALALLVSPEWSRAQQRREREANSVFAGRRAAIAAQVDGPVVLWGLTGEEESSQSYIFAQEDNFYYLTGHNEEGAGLIILPARKDSSATAN